jgi:hypothetical protein
VSFAFGFVAPVLIGTNLVPATSTNNISIPSGLLDELAGISVVAGALLAVGFALFYRGMRGIRDREFRTPSTLAALGAVGILLLAFVDLALILSLTQVLNCLATASPTNSTATLSCVDNGPVIAELFGLVAFAIITVIGYIGTAVGVYRLGRRHQETTLQVGAVLMCLPYLNLIGAILIIVGAHGARGRLRSRGSAAAAGFL